MRGLVIRWLVSAAALYVTSLIVRGIEIQGIFPLLFAAVTIGVLNAVVRPFVLLLTLPLTILTLGLFALVVNALMLEITAGITSRLTVSSFWLAVLAALIITVVSAIVNRAIGGPRRARA